MSKRICLEFHEEVSVEIVPDIGPGADDSLMVKVGYEAVFFPLADIDLAEFMDDERSAEEQRASVAAKLRALADRVEQGEP